MFTLRHFTYPLRVILFMLLTFALLCGQGARLHQHATEGMHSNNGQEHSHQHMTGLHFSNDDSHASEHHSNDAEVQLNADGLFKKHAAQFMMPALLLMLAWLVCQLFFGKSAYTAYRYPPPRLLTYLYFPPLRAPPVC